MVFRRINVFHKYTGRLDRWTAGGGVGVDISVLIVPADGWMIMR
jgi:hypothetical protein